MVGRRGRQRGCARRQALERVDGDDARGHGEGEHGEGRSRERARAPGGRHGHESTREARSCADADVIAIQK